MATMKWKQEQSQCKFAKKTTTHLRELMITKDYSQVSIEA